MSSKQIVIKERGEDLRTLFESGNNNVNLAFFVEGSNGQTSSNVIWQSTSMQNDVTTISWQPIYGLNFATRKPAPGMSIAMNGNWQQCNVGGAWALSKDGYWEPGDTSQAKPDSLNVTKNAYQTRGDVYIMLGMQDPGTGGFKIIWMDENGLQMNGSASYKPQDLVECWFGRGGQSGAMIARKETPSTKVNTSQPQVSLSYDANTGRWNQ